MSEGAARDFLLGGAAGTVVGGGPAVHESGFCRLNRAVIRCAAPAAFPAAVVGIGVEIGVCVNVDGPPWQPVPRPVDSDLPAAICCSGGGRAKEGAGIGVGVSVDVANPPKPAGPPPRAVSARAAGRLRSG